MKSGYPINDLSLGCYAQTTAITESLIVKAAGFSANGSPLVAVATAATDLLLAVVGDETIPVIDTVNASKKDAFIGGIRRVKSGAAVTFGSRITTDSVGRGINAVAGNNYIGTALSSTTAANQYFMVLIERGKA
jgi:hypothetical protein